MSLLPLSRRAVVLVSLLVSLLVPALAAPQVVAPAPVPYRPRSPEAIFRANCATCHGPQGTGGTSWIDPARHAPWIAGWPVGFIRWRVRTGSIPQMPAFPEQEISDAELAELARYVSGLPGSYVPEPAYQATVTLLDRDPWFSPMQISVRRGTTVRFVNAGRTWHPMPSLDYLESGGAIGTSSGVIGPGGTYFLQFQNAGVHTYLCGIHPYMRGEVHVGSKFTPPAHVPAAPAAAPAVPGQGEVWVCCQFQDWPGRSEDGVIQVIDAATWTVTDLIPVGNNPHNLWFGRGSSEALVTNWFDATVTRIDGATKRWRGDCVAGATPAHVTSDHEGKRWFVTIEGSRYVTRFDQTGAFSPCGAASSSNPVAWLGGYGPHGLWYGGGKLVTANSLDDTFSIVDADTMTELACLPAGAMPMGVATDATGVWAASGNMMGESVGFYDLGTLSHVRDVPISGHPIQVPFTPDGRYVFASSSAKVTVIDVAIAVDPLRHPDPASAVVAEIPTGNGAHGVAFGAKSGGGTYAYVTHKFENYVSVIDVSTMAKVGDVPLVTTTTGNVSLAGATDTGGNGVAVRPDPPPWK
jgi:mono/diheme cytochrome c family protein/DNA-binding beta-propeller fold protein YncE